MVFNLDEEKLARQNGDDAPEEESSSQSSRERIFSRLNFLRVGVFGGFTVLGWRLWDMQLNRPPEVREAAARTQTRDITIKAPRGLIYDSKGKLLVKNVPTYAVTITRADMPNPKDPKLKGSKFAKDREKLEEKRQLVFDTLARFLNMPFVIGIVPEQVASLDDRNAVLNTLEGLTGISARDLEKVLREAKANETDKSLQIIKKDIPLNDFDNYASLRKIYGVYFLSQGERIVLESEFRTYDFEPIVIWPNITRDDANILDEKRLDLPGVGIQTGYVREYERPDLFAHILGYLGAFNDNDEVNAANTAAMKDYINPDDPNDLANRRRVYSIDDRIGRTGIEYRMEAFLRGSKGGRSVEVNNAGNIVTTVQGSERKPEPGDNVYLTIDTQLQEVMTKALQDEMNRIVKEKPTSKDLTAAGVVMDVRTGEVLALVSLPSYNNNLFRPGINEAEFKELQSLFTAPPERAPLLNRAIAGLYPPGSTFKMITALAGLDTGTVLNGTTFNCGLYIYIPTAEDPTNPNYRRRFKCWGRHGPMNVTSAIKNSCDIYFYNVGQEYEVNQITGQPVGYFDTLTGGTQTNFRGTGIDKINKYMEMFGIGKPTGIELPGESKGYLPTKADYPNIHPGGNWSVGATITTSIGQGDLLMTPLQLCNMTAAIANGGKLLQPRIVKKVVDVRGNLKVPDEVIRTKDIIKDAGLAQRHLQTIREGMLQVTQPGGTADRVMAGKMGKLLVAGKTGTAEYGEKIGEDQDKNPLYATYAWFTCFAPYNNPEIAVSILIATGNSVTEGATYAVPAAKAILEARFPTLTEPPKTATPVVGRN